MKGATRIKRKTQSQETKPTTESGRTEIETTTQNEPDGQTSSYHDPKKSLFF